MSAEPHTPHPNLSTPCGSCCGSWRRWCLSPRSCPSWQTGAGAATTCPSPPSLLSPTHSRPRPAPPRPRPAPPRPAPPQPAALAWCKPRGRSRSPCHTSAWRCISTTRAGGSVPPTRSPAGDWRGWAPRSWGWSSTTWTPCVASPADHREILPHPTTTHPTPPHYNPPHHNPPRTIHHPTAPHPTQPNRPPALRCISALAPLSLTRGRLPPSPRTPPHPPGTGRGGGHCGRFPRGRGPRG